jgi:hypothetical protein
MWTALYNQHIYVAFLSGNESLQGFFYRLFIYVMPLQIQFVCAYPKPVPEFSISHVVIFLCSVMIVRLVDIGWINV